MVSNDMKLFFIVLLTFFCTIMAFTLVAFIIRLCKGGREGTNGGGMVTKANG